MEANYDETIFFFFSKFEDVAQIFTLHDQIILFTQHNAIKIGYEMSTTLANKFPLQRLQSLKKHPLITKKKLFSFQTLRRLWKTLPIRALFSLTIQTIFYYFFSIFLFCSLYLSQGFMVFS